MLTYIAVATGLLSGVALLLAAYRRLFLRRTRAPESSDSGRHGLGIASTVALDRRRKLVAIRRDGFEHLVMIGGPNDALVKSGGIRANGCAPQKVSETWPQAQAVEEASSSRLNRAINRAERIFAVPGLIELSLLSGIAGAAIGLICGLFRMALQEADRLRLSLPLWWHGGPLLGCALLIAGAAAAGAFSTWLVRRFSPYAAGSGIPHVEAVIREELPPAPLVLVPVKFIGGILAIGAGFALGREGPCVQMGATLARFLGKTLGRNSADCRVLLAAGAGAGLAAAFNAPFAGSAFVLEELVRQFETRNAIAALGASGSAIVVARLFTGPAPDFEVTAIAYPTAGDNLLCFALGAAAGVLGVLYNRVLLGALALADHLARWPAEARAAAVGAAVGALAWFAPELAGGGDALTQRTLDGLEPLSLLPLFFILRLLLGAACYAAGTPGGLFAPLLVLGAQMGFVFGGLAGPGQADPASHAAAYAVVGMAALFTAAVRAPLTGMILVTEMTANSLLLLPMLGACFSAMAVATMLREPPIYDALRERTLRLATKKQIDFMEESGGRRTTP